MAHGAVSLLVLYWARCSMAYCVPLPEWLQPWLVAGSCTILIAAIAWAWWTTRRRR